jgi:hypothetical protein
MQCFLVLFLIQKQQHRKQLNVEETYHQKVEISFRMQCCESCHLSCCLHMSAMIFLFCFCFVFVLLLLCFVFITFFKRKLFVLFCFCFHRGFETSLSLLFMVFQILVFFFCFFFLQTLLFCFCFVLLFLLMKQKTHPSILFASDSFTQSSFLCRPTFCSKMSIFRNGICSNCHLLEHVFFK